MSVQIGVITIGDELLSGELADTNTQRIATQLFAAGYRLSSATTVGDTEERIVQALQHCAETLDVVIVSGGLGGTADDLTARAAARAFGKRLYLNDEALEQVRQRLTSLGRPLQPHHEKMALLPQKAGPLGNPAGLAPGFTLDWQGTRFFFLPGVPSELEAMLPSSLLPRLQRLAPAEAMDERRLQIFGLPESQVEQRLNEVELPDGVSLGFGVHYPFVTLKIRARGQEAVPLADHAETLALKALGIHLFGRRDETLAGVTADLLLQSGQTLALAESCTGGMIAAQLTDIPGSSDFLDRSGVVYANRAKRAWLGVPESTLQDHGAVSRECALAMAQGIRRAAGTDIGLSVTGIAGPGGGSVDKPVGTVFIGIATPQGVQAKGYRFNGDRSQVRQMTAATALDWIRRYLLQQGPDENR